MLTLDNFREFAPRFLKAPIPQAILFMPECRTVGVNLVHYAVFGGNISDVVGSYQDLINRINSAAPPRDSRSHCDGIHAVPVLRKEDCAIENMYEELQKNPSSGAGLVSSWEYRQKTDTAGPERTYAIDRLEAQSLHPDRPALFALKFRPYNGARATILGSPNGSSASIKLPVRVTINGNSQQAEATIQREEAPIYFAFSDRLRELVYSTHDLPALRDDVRRLSDRFGDPKEYPRQALLDDLVAAALSADDPETLRAKLRQTRSQVFDPLLLKEKATPFLAQLLNTTAVVSDPAQGSEAEEAQRVQNLDDLLTGVTALQYSLLRQFAASYGASIPDGYSHEDAVKLVNESLLELFEKDSDKLADLKRTLNAVQLENLRLS